MKKSLSCLTAVLLLAFILAVTLTLSLEADHVCDGTDGKAMFDVLTQEFVRRCGVCGRLDYRCGCGVDADGAVLCDDPSRNGRG